MSGRTSNLTPLGAYLKARRASVDPATLGYPMGRRRTAGLRREEVAQSAGVSVTWYTWLEQGRGGAPSADALDRIARALVLTEVEREHLFLLALGRPPEVHYEAQSGITPRLQRVLDALEFYPAFVKTSAWDIVAWNRAATLVFTDYAALPPERRNLLRLVFADSKIRAQQPEWESLARFVVAGFRADVARAGAAEKARSLVDDLCKSSAEFDSFWRENDVRAQKDGSKLLRHPVAGPLALEYSSFAVDGRRDLGLVVYTPLTPDDAQRIRALVTG